MNRHLFKKTLLLSSMMFIALVVLFNFPPKTLADHQGATDLNCSNIISCTTGTPYLNPTTGLCACMGIAGGACGRYSASNNDCPNGTVCISGSCVGNGSYSGGSTATANYCPPGAASCFNGSCQGECNTYNQYYNSCEPNNSVCVTKLGAGATCGPGGQCLPPMDSIQGVVFVDTNGNGKLDNATQYCSDTNKNGTCDTGEKTYSNIWSCWLNGGQNCIKSTATAEKGVANATVTIDSSTTKTDSNGKFNKSVAKADTHTVALTLPGGYMLSDSDGNTESRTVNGSASNINFAIQAAASRTQPAFCDPNGDGKQDSSDMTILENEWTGEAATKTADCNKDGVVNGLDFQILKDEINGVNIQTSLY